MRRAPRSIDRLPDWAVGLAGLILVPVLTVLPFAAIAAALLLR